MKLSKQSLLTLAQDGAFGRYADCNDKLKKALAINNLESIHLMCECTMQAIEYINELDDILKDPKAIAEKLNNMPW